MKYVPTYEIPLFARVTGIALGSAIAIAVGSAYGAPWGVVAAGIVAGIGLAFAFERAARWRYRRIHGSA